MSSEKESIGKGGERHMSEIHIRIRNISLDE